MKKQYIVAGMLIGMTSGLIALTDADAKKQGAEIINNLTTAHKAAFGVDNIYTTSLDAYMWNNAMSRMKTLVSTVISENKSVLGMKDSTLVSALDKITKADSDLFNNIQITRGVLQSPTNLQKQINILNQIASDMRQLQNSLQAKSMSGAKDEARLVLAKTAFFITAAATKAANDAKK